MNNVFIHIGPPKSGTSAIQKWLNEHREYLLTNGVYYPEHEIDENGVSSGNLLSLFSQDEGDFVIDKNKVTDTLEHFRASGAEKLLLSSEFFFKRMEQLAEYIPNAIFVGYLRFPLEVAESSYNQGVKRHAQVNAFGLPATPRAYQLEILSKLINKIGKGRFILRPYNQVCFKGNSILADFLSLFDIEPINVSNKKVNTSYTLEGLEFKRWFNQFNLGSLQEDMDRFLQREQSGTQSYSFVPPKIFEAFKSEFVEQMRTFCEENGVENSAMFIQQCEQSEQKPKLKQFINTDTFKYMLSSFLEQPGVLNKMVTLYENDWKYQQVEKSPERLAVVKDMLPWSKRALFKIKKSLGRG